MLGPTLDRRQLLSAITTLALGSVAGCSKTSKSLRLLGEDSSNLGAIRKYLADRKSTVSVERADFATATQKATADFAAKSGYYDIVLQYNFSLAPFARNRYVYTLDELRRMAPGSNTSFEADLLPSVWKELSYYYKEPFTTTSEIEPIGYPFAANTMILVCNRALFEDPQIGRRYRQTTGRALSAPVTWQEFAATAKLFSTTQPGLRGVVLQGATDDWLYYEWANFLFGMGGSVMNKEHGWQSDLKTPLTLDSQAAADAAELYLSLKPHNAGDFFAIDATAQREKLKAGNIAMAIMWTDYVPDLVKSNPGQFSFHPVPGSRSMIAGGTFFINRLSASAGQAFGMVCDLLRPDAQRELALSGLLPPTKSALSDPEVLKVPYMPAVKASLERGVYMAEAGPDSQLISREITKALQEAWQGKVAARQVPQVAQAAILKARAQ